MEEKKEIDNEKQVKQQLRKIVITTDGQTFQISNDTTCTLLEIREICRQVLMKTGGP